MATLAKNPTTVVSAGAWTNGANAYASDDVYATNTGATQNTEYPLDLGGFDFSAIPAGSTINSVTVSVESKASNANRAQIAAQAYDGTTLLTGALALTTISSTADVTRTFSPTVTLAQLKSANFKIRVINKRTASQTCTTSLDWVGITVDYTPPVPPDLGSGVPTVIGVSNWVGFGGVGVTGYPIMTTPAGTQSGDTLVCVVALSKSLGGNRSYLIGGSFDTDKFTWYNAQPATAQALIWGVLSLTSSPQATYQIGYQRGGMETGYSIAALIALRNVYPVPFAKQGDAVDGGTTTSDIALSYPGIIFAASEGTGVPLSTKGTLTSLLSAAHQSDAFIDLGSLDAATPDTYDFYYPAAGPDPAVIAFRGTSGAAPAMLAKVWNGVAWVAAKFWNGTAWRDDAKVWNGVQWVPFAEVVVAPVARLFTDQGTNITMYGLGGSGTVTASSTSTGTITSTSWTASNATPSSASGPGPHNFVYGAAPGTITLTVTGPGGSSQHAMIVDTAPG